MPPKFKIKPKTGVLEKAGGYNTNGIQVTPKWNMVDMLTSAREGTRINTPDLGEQTIQLGKDIVNQVGDAVKTYQDEGIVSGITKSINTALNIPAEIGMHFTGVTPILKKLEENQDTKKVADIVNFIPEQINNEVDKRFELPEQELEKIQNPELKLKLKNDLKLKNKLK